MANNRPGLITQNLGKPDGAYTIHVDENSSAAQSVKEGDVAIYIRNGRLETVSQQQLYNNWVYASAVEEQLRNQQPQQTVGVA